MADPVSDAIARLMAGDYLCLLGLVVGFVMLLLLIVILRIRKSRHDSKWAYNPDKKLKLKWRRG